MDIRGEDIELILGYLTTFFLVLTSVITYVSKLIRKIKEVRSLKDEGIVDEELKELISEAETMYQSGVEKKDYVIKKIKEFMGVRKIKIKKSDIDEKISEMVSFTKKVNSTDKKVKESPFRINEEEK
ncbi:hypothetical protein LJC17_04925 [Acholeplasma sp. OttesenSCG-928-E16]|nr:hypothetical protein [Acholeplasma sp. OttesenSCG-928-E16]